MSLNYAPQPPRTEEELPVESQTVNGVINCGDIRKLPLKRTGLEALPGW